MNKVIFIVLSLIALQASATVVNTCRSGAADTRSATISGCAKGPCTLKRGSTVSVSLKFTSSSPIKNLIANVKVFVFGMTIGFPGVDGHSVCGKIFKASDNSPAPCPLSKGVEYIYKDSFPVSNYAPTGNAPVIWALKSGSKITKCVKVNVRIR